jgi:hypothetical protein
MLEFYIDNVGFKVESIDALKRLIEEDLVDDVVNILVNIFVMQNSEIDFVPDSNMGFSFGDEEDEET